MNKIYVPISEKRYLSLAETKAYYGLGTNKTRQLVEEIGAMRRVGKRIVVDRTVVDRYLERLAVEQGDPE